MTKCPCVNCETRKAHENVFASTIWGDDCPYVCTDYQAWKRNGGTPMSNHEELMNLLNKIGSSMPCEDSHCADCPYYESDCWAQVEKDMANVITLAKAEIAEKPKSKWIGVDDALPEIGQMTWVFGSYPGERTFVALDTYCEERGTPVCRWYGGSRIRIKSSGWNAYNDADITHWMPAEEPDPPEICDAGDGRSDGPEAGGE